MNYKTVLTDNDNENNIKTRSFNILRILQLWILSFILEIYFKKTTKIKLYTVLYRLGLHNDSNCFSSTRK